MAVRFAFMGFRHGHLFGLYNRAAERDDVEIVAACEEDAETRRQLADAGQVRITHESYEAMLDEVDCDVIATGDYYGRRGAIAIDALKRGRHVIADKPLCTSLAELDEIEQLASAGGLVVGCMLDMRDHPNVRAIRKLIADGRIGEVHAVSFGGQHPLKYGSRPGWYFEEGKHGGTITDIAIHAIDLIPWVTGLSFSAVNAARNWNGAMKQVPHFRDCGQVMLTLSNAAGVLGDVSYLAPDACGYATPLYWRMTFWGACGVIETSVTSDVVTLYRSDEDAPRTLTPEPVEGGGYLDSFLAEIGGQTDGLHLSSAEVLKSMRTTLTAQQAADENRTNLPL